MTLDEAFSKYSDDKKMIKKSQLDNFMKLQSKLGLDEEKILQWCKKECVYTIKWLKSLKSVANEESRKLGFLIPQFMIDDANADDWEIVDEI